MANSEHSGDRAGLDDIRAELRLHDRERYLTALFMPEPRRRQLLTLYAFNLELARSREHASDPMLGRIRLQWWRDTLAQLERGGAPPNPLAALLAGLLKESALANADLLSLVEGRERDMDHREIADLDELRGYVDATAGALLRCTQVLLDRDSEAAGEIAIAYGLAGIIRAVPFHAQSGRMYLPLSLLRIHGLSAEDVLAHRASDKLRSVVADLAAAGVKALRAAKGASAKEVGLPVLLHGELAKRHLKTIMNRRYDPYDPPPSGGGLSALHLQWRSWRGRL